MSSKNQHLVREQRKQDGAERRWAHCKDSTKLMGSSGAEMAFRVVPSWSKGAEPLDSNPDQSSDAGCPQEGGLALVEVALFNCEWLLERNSAESHKQPALQEAGG